MQHALPRGDPRSSVQLPLARPFSRVASNDPGTVIASRAHSRSFASADAAAQGRSNIKCSKDVEGRAAGASLVDIHKGVFFSEIERPRAERLHWGRRTFV